MLDSLDKDYKKTEENLDKYNDSLKESVNLTEVISRNVASLAGGYINVGKQGTVLVNHLKDYSKTLNKTLNLSDKLASGKLKEKELVNHIKDIQKKYNDYLEETAKRGSYIKKNQKAQRDLQKEVITLEEQFKSRQGRIVEGYETLDALQTKLAEESRKYHEANDIVQKRDIANRIGALKREIKESSSTLDTQERIQRNAEKTLDSKSKELTKVKEISKAHKDLKKLYEEELENNGALLESMKQQNSWGKTMLTLQDKIKEYINDVQNPLTILTASWEFLKDLGFKISEQATNLQKRLVLSAGEALNLRQEYNKMAVSSGDVAVTTERLIVGNAELSEQLGFNSKFTEDLNIQFVKLTKRIGLSVEAAGGLAKLSIATGKTLEESKNTVLGVNQTFSSQYGIQLDQKEVLEEIGKISGQTLVMFKASPKALAEAVAQSKLLGTNLELVRKQAEYLLNFESSIESELQAELLSGRQLNLERARSAALYGDLTTVVKELNSQNIDFNKFSNMNVIAQNKISEALGLSSDELSDQLLKQQYMRMSREQIVALGGKEVADKIEALNAQDKFNLSIEKMKDALGNIIGGPLGKMMNVFGKLAESSAFIYGTMAAIGSLSLAKTITNLATMAATLASSAIAGTTLASALTIGLGGIAIVGAITAITAAMLSNTKKAQDYSRPMAEGGLLYGPTKILAGEYPDAPNNPEVIAPLSDLRNIIEKDNRRYEGNSNKENIEMISNLNKTLREVRDGIYQLRDKKGIVLVDGQQVGTSQLMGNYNLA